ncbi:MAG: STAS domain-containing protein [Chloroflexota bacterium]|nr:STAS domain-containing protein [Chloroflexota bacterium]
MEIIIKEHQNCNSIKITGRIDSYTTPKIKQALQTLIDDDHHNLVLDLSDVNFLSSTGILMFVNIQKQLLKNKIGKIVFSEVPDLVYANIKLSGFQQLFEFVDNTTAAIDRF